MLKYFRIIVQCYFYHVFSKILERLEFDNYTDYINTHEIFNDKQFGFWSKHSIYMAIIELVDKINNVVEKMKQQ